MEKHCLSARNWAIFLLLFACHIISTFRLSSQRFSLFLNDQQFVSADFLSTSWSSELGGQNDSEIDGSEVKTKQTENVKKYWFTCHQKPVQNNAVTAEEMFESANCGAGFHQSYLSGVNNSKNVSVALYGKAWTKSLRRLSGCPLGTGNCPYYPKCSFYNSTNISELAKADVIVTPSNVNINMIEINNLRTLQENLQQKRQYRVLYWREPYWESSIQAETLFDIELGVHYWSAQMSPVFLRSPEELLKITLQMDGLGDFRNNDFFYRPNFAMSAISTCKARSMRQHYISSLIEHLGSESDLIHQYGSCGDGKRELPQKPLGKAAKIIKTYKFFLSFENTIVDGYVSEKLFAALSLGVVPVYFGAPDVYNITKTKSFINVMDYKSPKELAEHLLYLSKNKTAYMEYHSWRFQGPSAFTPEFLRLVSQNKPSKMLRQSLTSNKEKYNFLKDRKGFHPDRRLACCKLCNLKWVQETAGMSEEALRKGKRRMVSPPWSQQKLRSRFGL